MTRIPTIVPDELTPEQRKVHDAIVSTRSGKIGGPFALWIRNPTLAAAADQMGGSLRLQGKLDPKLFEIIILVVACHFTAQYEWFAHARDGARAGVEQDIIEAIRTRRMPPLKTPEQVAVYELARELLETTKLTDASYARGLEMFGLDLMVEIVTVIGFYSLVAMVLNAFEAPVPGDVRPLD